MHAPTPLQQEQAGARSLLGWVLTIPPARIGSWVGKTHSVGKPELKVQAGGSVSTGNEVRARDLEEGAGDLPGIQVISCVIFEGFLV